MLLIRKNQVQQEDNAPYYDKIIRAIDNYIEENFRRANLVNAAETVGISAGYLSKIYKEKKGIGFQEQLNCVRMKKAVSMLMDVSFKREKCNGYVLSGCFAGGHSFLPGSEVFC